MMAFGMTTGRILQGLGHGLPSFIITSIRVLGVGVTLAYLAVYVFDAPIEAVWASIVTGGLISNVLSFFWVRQIVWRGDPTKKASGKDPRLGGARRP
jgi:Na+-driven multidrug efflux pump